MAYSARDPVELLETAADDLQAGRLGRAEQRLRAAQATPLPAALQAAVAALAARLHTRRELAARLDQARAKHAVLWETGRFDEAVAVLRRMLDTLLEPAVDLPPAARVALLALLGSVPTGTSSGTGLADWSVIRPALQQLREDGKQHWTAAQAGRLAARWARAARWAALDALRNSAAALGNRLESYRAAVLAVRLRPADPTAAGNLTEAGTALAAELTQRAGRHIAQAEEALEQQDLDAALEELGRVEQTYAPVARYLPRLRTWSPEVTHLRERARQLRAQVERLQVAYARSRPLLAAARLSYLANDLEGARAWLEQVGDAAEPARLREEIETLRGEVQQAYETRARRALYVALLTAETRLPAATTAAECAQLLRDLEAIQQEAGVLNVLRDKEQRARYDRLHAQIRMTGREIAKSTAAYARARRALEQEQYAAAVPHLEQALAGVRDVAQKVELERLLRAAREYTDAVGPAGREVGP